MHCEWTNTNPGSLEVSHPQYHPEKIDYYSGKLCSLKFMNLATWKKHRRSCGNQEKVNASGYEERKRHAASSCVHDEHDHVAAEVENEDDDQHVGVDETWDVPISCEECFKVSTLEDFMRHQEQTGHTGEIIKGPADNLYLI